MSELVEIAILAYRHGRYRDAIEILLQATDTNADNWLAKLYLAMSYQKSGSPIDAVRVLKALIAECQDPLIREKAQNTLLLAESELRRSLGAKDSGQSAKRKDAGDGNDDRFDVAT